ncbi:carboxymuconolactone decarboxylase family protein [Chishuiella sp.]|uniref:carboxymuconolactone decarboxylase family protein n=1 Tax=Chishuiella sp. TaxID=1969467 RepID=UPI0028AC92C0|nr:carboxymuconolactone decarboxylase family protein [Chishuiella sp.]
MKRINISDNGSTMFEKMIGHNNHILKKWNDLDEVLWKETSLDKNLLEQIRRTLAFENKCEYCMVKAGKPDYDVNDIKTSVVCGFAELFCKDHFSISEKHFEILKEFLSDKEISELCTFIAFIQASQKLGKIFNLSENDQKNAVIKLKDIENV